MQARYVKTWNIFGTLICKLSELIFGYTSKVGGIFLGSSQLVLYCTGEGSFIKVYRNETFLS